MVKGVSNIIISSISMAFLVILSWSTAYAYGWGQAYFYGYPIWYVDINTSNIARSIGYLLVLTTILFLISLISFWFIRFIKPFISENVLNTLRAFIPSTIIWLPLFMMSVIALEEVHWLAILVYILCVLILTKIFKCIIESQSRVFNSRIMLNYLKQQQHYIIICTYLYCVAASFVVGCARPYFLDSVDMLEIENKMYYVIAKYDDAIILSKNIKRDKEDFYIYRVNAKSLLHLRVNQPITIGKVCKGQGKS